MSQRLSTLHLAFVALLLQACDKQVASSGLKSSVEGSITSSFFVERMEPAAEVTGKTVTVFGNGFVGNVKITFDDGVEAVVQKNENASIAFVVPAGKAGIKTVSITQGSDRVTMPFFQLSDGGFPVIADDDPTLLCQGLKYYSTTGELREGTRDCGTVAPACAADGQTGCLATTSHPSVDIEGLAAKVIAGQTVAGIKGAATVPDKAGLSPKCLKDGEIACVTSAAFPAADLKNFRAADLPVGVTAAGVVGTRGDVTPACKTEGETDCDASAPYVVVDAAKLLASNIRTGVTLGAVAGAYPSAAFPLFGTTPLTSLPGLVGTTAAGTYEWFTADGTHLSGTIQDAGVIVPGTTDQNYNGFYRAFSVKGDANLVGSNIAAEVQIFGVPGSVPSYSLCTGNSQSGCVATNTYRSADLSNLSAANIKNGATIAGVTGSYPSATYHLAADLNLAGLPAFGVAMSTGTYQYFDATGAVQTGAVADGGTVHPGTTDQQVDATNTVYRHVTVAGEPSLIAGNILLGRRIFGVDGSVQSRPGDCTTNGQTSCVATPAFEAIDVTNLTSGNVKNGVNVGGVVGDYPSLSYPLPSANTALTPDLPNLAASVSPGSYEWFKSDGSRVIGSILAVGAGDTVHPTQAAQLFGAGVYRSFSVAGDTNLVPANIANGVAVFDQVGSLVGGGGGPGNCSGDGQQNCVVLAPYRSFNNSWLSAGDIRNGATVAGTTGQYPSLTYPLSADTSVADLNDATLSSQLASATAFRWWDAMGNLHTATGDTALAPANIRSSASIFGYAGSVAAKPADCTAEASVGCVTTTAFKSVDMNNVSAGNIKKGVTLAGQVGDYPSVTYPLGTLSNDLKFSNFNSLVTGGASFDWWDSSGVRYANSGDTNIVAAKILNSVSIFGVTGSVVPKPGNCTTDGNSSGCVTVSGFPSAKLANFSAGNITSGVTIAGVAGALGQCTGNGATGCVANATYQAADLTYLTPANVKNGVVVAGVTGQYPSATYKLPSSSGSDLPALDSTMATGLYQYYDSTGTRRTGTIADGGTVTPTTSNVVKALSNTVYRAVTVLGDPDLVGANIKFGVNIFSVDGALSSVFGTSCLNDGDTNCLVSGFLKAANTTGMTAWDVRVGKSIGGIAGSLKLCKNTATANTVSDTMDDFNYGPPNSLPPVHPFGDDDACGDNFTVAADGCNSSACYIKDNITNLTWSKEKATANWSTANATCTGMASPTFPTGWRLPSQKELGQLYIDGGRQNFLDHGSKFISATTDPLWTSTTNSSGNGNRFYGTIGHGSLSSAADTTSYNFLCVHD